MGQSVTFTATVVPSTGTVTFLDGTTALGSGTLSGGVATFSSSTFAAGTHSITASYSGDSNYRSSLVLGEVAAKNRVVGLLAAWPVSTGIKQPHFHRF